LAKQHKPKLIIAGGSAYSRIIDFKKFREIADKINAYLMVDMAHFSGLVAGKGHPNPIEYADVVTSTTHKVLRGGRGGIILTNREDIIKKINSAVFPGYQGGPLMHIIAAKAVTFQEALHPSFKNYIKSVLANAKILSENLKNKINAKYKELGLLKKENDYIFTDKTLDNFFFLGLIKKIFPQAKVINCRRNPLASIMSILKNNLGDVAWAHNIEHIFSYFDLYYKKINFFKKSFPNFIYDLQFENFQNDPENESKKLMQFCNLSWNKKCLEFYKRKDIVSYTASHRQIRNPIYKDSIDKYQPYKGLLNRYGNKYNWFS